jgi:hypothetical protein
MRFVYEALQIFGMPMVPARLLVVAVHALLHDRPLAVIGDEESVQIEIEAVLDRGAVDLGDEAARAGKLGAVEADTFAQQAQLPSFPESGCNPRLRAPMTLVVMPDECQSMPMTAPKAWNQNG